MNTQAQAEDKRKPFVSCVALEELALDSLTLNVVRERVHDKGELSLDFNIKTRLEAGENTFFKATAECSLLGQNLNDEMIFELKLSYFVLYRCKEVYEWPAEEMQHFANRNVIIHVWPYLREAVDQMSRRASLNRVILPLLPPGAVDAKHDHDNS